MAQIDVSDILLDPDLVDEILLINRVPRINLHGENSLIETISETFGCVQPASGRTISRLPEALRVANVSSFWVKGTIVASAPGKYAAVLSLRGVRYNVQTVQDWSNWGEGWCEGTCVAESPA